MKYNTKKIYNAPEEKGGAKYNSAIFFVLVNVFEAMAADDKLGDMLAKAILSDEIGVRAIIEQYSMKKLEEMLSGQDKPEVLAYHKLDETASVKSMFNDIVVSLYFKEEFSTLEEFMRAINFLEKLNFKEQIDTTAFQKVLDSIKTKEISQALAKIVNREYTAATDHQPVKAISDFLIGYMDNMDRAFEYFFPLGMMYDAEKSSIQVMPAAENTYIEMPYMDGTTIENTVYKNRFFNIVAWSQDGMTIAQKEQLKADIVRLLDATKDGPHKLTFQKSDISFDVKYSGNADIKEGPTFVKATLPFEAPPYGHPTFNQAVHDSGLIVNRGDAPAFPIVTIEGPCNNPSFQLGSVNYVWNGSVPSGSKLVVDHENMTCYTEDKNGNKVNGMAKLTGQFQSIEPKKSMQIDVFDSAIGRTTTKIQERILWRK